MVVNLSKAKIVFFTIGLALFVYLIYRFGLERIFENIRRAGWSMAYVILVWLAIYLLNAAAWRIVLGARGSALAFHRLFMITVSGFVINYITPVIALGGEPYKVDALAVSMGPQRSLSAVVLYRMVHLLGHMLLLLTGIACVLLLLPLPPAIASALGFVGVLILALIALTLSGNRNGVFQRIAGFASRSRLLGRVGRALTRYQDDLHEMDRVITDAYHHERPKFYAAILLEYASRVLMGVEVFLILRGVGVETSLLSAMFLYVSYSIIINLLFFIPLNLGAREGGLILGLESLALPPLLGVYLGVVMRIREFFWILVGLLFILMSGERSKTSPAKIG